MGKETKIDMKPISVHFYFVNKIHLDVCLQEVQSLRALDPHNKIHH